MAHSIQEEQDYDEQFEVDLHQQTFSDSISSKSNKIKKKKPKQKKGAKSSKHNQKQLPQVNLYKGRPGKPREEELDQKTKDILSKQWFGQDIATQILIFLCTKGNMILKIKTGQPAALNAKNIKEQLDERKQKEVRKFKKKLKKQLKAKHASILQHLKIPKNTTYMFLGMNPDQNDTLRLPENSNISKTIKQGLEVILKYLSPEFVATYKLMIGYYFLYHEYTIDTIIDKILRKLKANFKDHQMIFNMQLIQLLLKSDYELIDSIVRISQSQEKNPSEAEEHQLNNTSIAIPNFSGSTYNDEQEAILNESKWIGEFTYDLICILKAYH